MYATIPVYYPSLEEADRNDERELWLESYHINMDCKRAIEDRAATAFNTGELDSLIKDLIENYGVERAMYVLSRTVQFREWDERFDKAVSSRAEAFSFSDTDKSSEQAEYQSSDYITEIDPCVLDHIYLGLMKAEIDLNLEANNEYFESLQRDADDESGIGDLEVYDD